MKFKFSLRAAALAFIIFAISSCTRCANIAGSGGERAVQKNERIFVVSYNTQTFFDAIQDGREFAEFKGKKSKWNAEKYKTRLARLKEAGELSVQLLGGKKGTMPDIFVLEEIESTRVVEDFAKQFSAYSGYSSVVFFPPEGSGSFSTAIFSKFPVVDFQQFRLEDNRFDTDGLRPLVQATVEIDTGDKAEYLTILAVHWKSKLGNDTDLIRAAQEKQVFRHAEELCKRDPHAMILICGDFNQKPEEFSLLNVYENIWNFPAQTKAALGANGSFYFRGNWEAIDHIFYTHSLNDARGLDIVDFSPVAVQPLVTNKGETNKYKVYSGSGYSDHLPICCALEFLPDQQ